MALEADKMLMPETKSTAARCVDDNDETFEKYSVREDLSTGNLSNL